ncbi:MAG: M48 family metallopeptidase [Candidatus Marinimicrobia bacterium]|nr:M48 family metallopeptidase [Candidatus Neomarinimicrobiota bacterium]
MDEKIELKYGARKFVVDVVAEKRKRLSVTVHPDLRITAKAPAECELEIILKHLEKRASWIARQIDFFEQFQPLPTERKFVSGETHYYLGRQYRLKIRPGGKARVRLIGRFFEMELPDTSNKEKARALMLDWYSAHARDLLSRRLAQYVPTFERMGAVVPEVRYRRMKKRWGSCSGKGVIMLNTELVKAPTHCIDYVIIHELCHLLYPHHDKKFYHLLGRILPDWEKRKERLEKVVI